MAYIATKTSKITKSNKSNYLLQGQNRKKSKEEQKGKTSNWQHEQCVRSEQCAGGMNSGKQEANFATCEISQLEKFYRLRNFHNPAKFHCFPFSLYFLLFFPSGF